MLVQARSVLQKQGSDLDSNKAQQPKTFFAINDVHDV